MAFIGAQAAAFCVGVLLAEQRAGGSPSSLLGFWAVLTVALLATTVLLVGLLMLWAEPWSRRRLAGG